MTDTPATTNGSHPAPAFDQVDSDLLMAEIDSLRESLDAAMLELAMEDAEWRRMSASAGQEFSKAGIDKAAELARLMALKNPIVKRGLEVQGNYVFGQGVSIRARAPQLQPLIASFLTRNRDQLFGLQIQLIRDRELACDGNLFLALWTDPLTGDVTIRRIPQQEVVDIITDPEDRAVTQYIKRTWTQKTLQRDGTTKEEQRTALYPDWRYRPRNRPQNFGGTPVMWQAPVYHIAVGAFSDWLFGLSEIYSVIDWARAYKSMLEDWATITRALARFAWKRRTAGTSRAVQAATRQMATTIGQSGQGERNPPPPAGASAIMGGSQEDLEPMKTAGATTKMEDARRLLLMVAAGQGLPETFYGDASVGALATARSLDRPTELKMQARQQLYRETFDDLCAYQLLASARAPRGAVRVAQLATVARAAAAEYLIWRPNSDDPERRPIDAVIEQDWPRIVEPDPKAEVDAVVAAAPRLPSARLVARELLRALRIADADALLAEMFPEGDTPNAKPNRDPDESDNPDDREPEDSDPADTSDA